MTRSVLPDCPRTHVVYGSPQVLGAPSVHLGSHSSGHTGLKCVPGVGVAPTLSTSPGLSGPTSDTLLVYSGVPY